MAIFGAVGVAFSGTIVTLYLFYEVITVFTYPLVAHHQDAEGYNGARKYLVYLMTYHLGVDGLSLYMVLLTALMLPLTVLGSWTYISKRVKEFHFCLLLMTSACIGVFTALDFVLFYVFWEAMASDLTEGIEVQYHFSLLDGPTRLVLRLIVPHDAPDVPSIAAIYPGANWHECECFDFYGIRFVGHPDLHRLLLPEDFEGHPLLKAPEARRSLGELMPSSYCRACGLAEPDTPAAASAPAVKTGPSDA